MLIDTFNLSKKVFIVAELSANHGHDINIAKESIKVAKDIGVDAVKLQTYTPNTITIDCNNKYFKIDQGTIWDGKTLYNLYKEAYIPWKMQKELIEYAKNLGIICFSTPFDKSAVDFLEDLSIPAYKIASFEINDIPLIKYIASKKKPILISTGIASLGEIEEAINTCKLMGNDRIVLLKCTSAYPAKVEDSNLKTMENMKKTFDVEIGLSDHTLGTVVPIAAVALGARVIEKHFILDKSIGGPDASFSLDKDEFKSLVTSIREAEKCLGKVDYKLTVQQSKNKEFSRSLFIVEEVKKGDMLTEQNVRSIRPFYGLHPRYYNQILGKKAKCDIKKGTPLSWQLIN